MSKRRTTSSKTKQAEAPTNEALMTVQLSDLDLGRASKPAKGKATSRTKKAAAPESGELLDQVSELLEQNKTLESSRNSAIEQVDAISQKIEKLTANIGGDCDCDETADKVNELDAKLLSLQNALKKQGKRGDKMEAGFQLVEELGNKIESLSDQVRLGSIESEVTEDYTEQFSAVGDKLTVLYQIIEGQSVDSKLVSSQVEKTAKLEEKLDLLVKVTKESAKESQKDNGVSKAIADLAKQVKAVEALVQKPQPELKEISGVVGKMSGMQVGIESLASLIQNQDAPQVDVPDYSKQFAAIAEDLNKNLVKQVDALGELIISTNEASAAPQVEVPDFAEQFEAIADGLNKNLVKQVDALGELIVNTSSSNETAGVDFSEQFEKLSTSLNNNLEAKVASLQAAIDKSSELKAEAGDASEQFLQLSDKLQHVQEAVASNSGKKDSTDYSEKFEELAMQFAELQETVTEKWQSTSVSNGNGESNLLLEKFEAFQQSMEERFQSLPTADNSMNELVANKLNALQDQFANQAPAVVEGTDYSGQLTQLGEKVEWMSQLMEERNGGSDSAGESVDYSEQLSQLTGRLDETQSKIDLLVQSIGPLVEQLAQGGVASPTDTKTESALVEESPWERQKRELLAGYGAEPGSDSDAIKGDSPSGEGEERGEWINEGDNEDDTPTGESAEVLALKAELEEKLRRAEIEISIQRAKLSREKQKVEQQKQDVDQKIAKLRVASEDESNPDGNGRWSRFLGKKNDD